MDKVSNDFILELITSTFREVEGSHSNSHYDSPLIGFSSSDDSYYKYLKRDIGEFYWLPVEAFSLEYDDFEEAKLNVISLVFPQTKQTRDSNRVESELASYEWAYNRLEGQQFINSFMLTLADKIRRIGIKVMVPSLNDNWCNNKSDKYGYASSWSERHTAFISGLGTFGLSDGLITTRGKAHRCSSLIVELDLLPTARSYSSYNEYCLYYKDGSCNACIRRCPAVAISGKGHDKYKCREYQIEVIRPHNSTSYNLDSNGCGLCQVGVPCEFRVPG